MKTIFDYNPTKKELIELFGFDEESNSMAFGFSIIRRPRDRYDTDASHDEKLLDLAQLLELREQQDEANKLWAKIPDIERQYRGGFDNVQVPV